MASVILGLDCKLYYNDVDMGGSGTIATPNWIEIESVEDVRIAAEFDESDQTVRGASGFEIVEPSIQKVTIEANIKWMNGDTTGAEVLRTAFFARSALDILIATGDHNNADARGYRGDFKVVAFPMDQPLRDGVVVAVKLRPCRSTRSNFIAKWQ